MKSDKKLEEFENVFYPDMNDEDLLHVADKKFANIPSVEARLGLIKKIYESYMEETLKYETILILSNAEVDFLRRFDSDVVRRLFYALILATKLHPHESGWIRFDIEEMKMFSGIKKLKIEDFFILTEFGFDVRVYGKKKPIVVYRIPEIETCENSDDKDSVKILGKEAAKMYEGVMNGNN